MIFAKDSLQSIQETAGLSITKLRGIGVGLRPVNEPTHKMLLLIT